MQSTLLTRQVDFSRLVKFDVNYASQAFLLTRAKLTKLTLSRMSIVMDAINGARLHISNA